MRALLPIVCPLIVAGASAAAPALAVDFADRSADAGITVVNRCGADPRWFIPESNGTGAAWLDYDLDGDLDLYVVNGNGLEYLEGRTRLRFLPDASDRLYRNDGVWRFTDVTEEAGCAEGDWGNGVAVADVESDGDPDLYVANLGPDRLWLNEGDGTFRDATTERGLGHPGWSTGAAFGDVDRDGDLDLYVPCYVEFDPENPPDGGRIPTFDGVQVGYGPEGENPGINPGAPDVFYLNDGGGFFTEATAERGFALEKALCSYSAVFCDVDGDGWQDLLVTNDKQPSQLFVNRGDGFFVEEGEARGFARGADGKVLSSMGLAVADVDDDGDLDAFVTNFDFEPNNLRLNDGRGFFTEAADAAGLNAPNLNRLGWGCGFFDAELDGDLDLFVANGHVIPQCEQIGMSPWRMANHLFLRDGAKSGAPAFALWEAPAGSPLAIVESSRATVFGDPDADGDVDLIVIDMDRPPQVLENRSERRGRWLAVELQGTRSPRDAYGARVEVEAGGRTRTSWKIPNQGIYSSNDPVVHFGLGPVDRVDRVRVRWTGGAVSELGDVDADRRVVIREPEEGG
ncbi:MAG: CRTAC1 family protein [Candidatus Eiseniibacteriota bacterium]